MGRIERIRNFYLPWISRSGSNAERLAWNNTHNQLVRFDALKNNVDLNGKSLLDVGCGFGDLYGYLLKNDVKMEYTGIDVLKPMIRIARNNYPTAKFYHTNIFKNPDDVPNHDVVFASGTFNLKIGNNSDFIKKVIDVFNLKSKEVFCFNLLHERSSRREKIYYYTNPEQVMKLLDHHDLDVNIVDDYLENDFTIICRKYIKEKGFCI